MIRVFVKLLLTIILVLTTIAVLQVGKPANERSLKQIVDKLPLMSLAIKEYKFNIVLDAAQTESAKIWVRLFTAGLLGNEKTTKILFRAGVRIKYGIDFSKAPEDWCKQTKTQILLTIPQPQIIGKPQLLSEGEDAAIVLDRVPAKNNTAFFEQNVRNIIQGNSTKWPEIFDLQDDAKLRTESLLKSFLQPIFPNHTILITYLPALP